MVLINSIRGECFCHESEDIEKVSKAFQLFFPEKKISIQVNQGFFGTKIKVLKAELKGKEAQDLLEKIISYLSKEEKNEILNHLENYSWEAYKLILTFDKQKAFSQQKISLSQGSDVIKLIISFQQLSNKNFNTFLKEILG